jgi:hypothetical protein
LPRCRRPESRRIDGRIIGDDDAIEGAAATSGMGVGRPRLSRRRAVWRAQLRREPLDGDWSVRGRRQALPRLSASSRKRRHGRLPTSS